MRLLCNPTSGINQVRGTQLRVTGRWRTNWGSGPPPSMRQSGTVAGQMSTPLGFSQPLTRRRLMSCCCRICLGIWGTSHRSRRACRPRRCRMSGDDGHVSLACLLQAGISRQKRFASLAVSPTAPTSRILGLVPLCLAGRDRDRGRQRSLPCCRRRHLGEIPRIRRPRRQCRTTRLIEGRELDAVHQVVIPQPEGQEFGRLISSLRRPLSPEQWKMACL